jgi:hypothetical protein
MPPACGKSATWRATEAKHATWRLHAPRSQICSTGERPSKRMRTSMGVLPSASAMSAQEWSLLLAAASAAPWCTGVGQAPAVHDLSGMPELVTADGHSWPWTPYRYAVYLHWMRQTADAVGVEPDLLELTLFQPPRDVADEQDAADPRARRRRSTPCRHNSRARASLRDQDFAGDGHI